ncbi:MAG: hypothetical protein QM753_00430 [Thermomicrobiales bacterium]
MSYHTNHSVYREMVLEHLFVGEIMRYHWMHGLPHVEMLKSQVDASGYDIVLESGSITRHIQLKASHVGSHTPHVPINSALAQRPSGCIVWMYFDPETLHFTHFLWFGSDPGTPLPSIENFKVATHNKRNAKEIKTERKHTRMLPRGKFVRLDTIADVGTALFGTSTMEAS